MRLGNKLYYGAAVAAMFLVGNIAASRFVGKENKPAKDAGAYHLGYDLPNAERLTISGSGRDILVIKNSGEVWHRGKLAFVDKELGETIANAAKNVRDWCAEDK
jgi:hypothetical protein